MNICEKCGLEFSNKGGQIAHQNACKLTALNLLDIKNKYIELNYSINDIKKEYDLSTCIVQRILKGLTRSFSEARKIASKKYTLHHSDESKEKIRIARLKYMKEHPENTAWRTSTISYPENLFKEALERFELDKKYLIAREYSVFPYFIDFAFINEKLAIEIDGSQHLLEERKIKDGEKDLLLKNNGWNIIRIAENQIKTNIDEVIQIVLHSLETKEIIYQTIGIVTMPKIKEKVFRDENGYSEKEKLRALNQRKVERPSKEDLL